MNERIDESVEKKPTPAALREAIEAAIQTGERKLTDESRLAIDGELDAILDSLFTQYRRRWLDNSRLQSAMEIVRVIELKLTLLRNYSVDPTSDARLLSEGLTQVLNDAGNERLGLSAERFAYLRCILALHEGNPERAIEELVPVFADDEGDDTVRYHSHMIAAHVHHELTSFEEARNEGLAAAEYATSANQSAQALAVVGVNSYAAGERDRAMRELEDALRYFDSDEPLFNPYFYRNTLLLCGLICFEGGDDTSAESFCRRATAFTEEGSYDAFEAWSRLGRVLYRQGRIEEAAEAFETGIASYRYGESEVLLDVCLWLARASAELGRHDRARILLLRIVASEVDYSRSADAKALLNELPK